MSNLSVFLEREISEFSEFRLLDLSKLAAEFEHWVLKAADWLDCCCCCCWCLIEDASWYTNDWTEAVSIMELCLEKECIEEFSRAIASSSASSNDLLHSSTAVMVLEEVEDWTLVVWEDICWMLDWICSKLDCCMLDWEKDWDWNWETLLSLCATRSSKALSTSYFAEHCSRMSEGVFHPGTASWFSSFLTLCCWTCLDSCLKEDDSILLSIILVTGVVLVTAVS